MPKLIQLSAIDPSFTDTYINTIVSYKQVSYLDLQVYIDSTDSYMSVSSLNRPIDKLTRISPSRIET